MPRTNLIPRPSLPSISLLNLYRSVTGDLEAPEELIRTLIRQETDKRLLVVSLRMKGYSYPQISGALRRDHTSVERMIGRVMRSVYKVVHNAPRYRTSRKGMGGCPNNILKYNAEKAAEFSTLEEAR